MLDIKRVRLHYNDVLASTLCRGKGDYGLGALIHLDTQRRDFLVQIEQKRELHNKNSKLVPILMQQSKDTNHMLSEMRLLSEEIHALEVVLNETDTKINSLLLNIPNELRKDTPDSPQNVPIRLVGDLPQFNFKVKPHWEIGTSLDILDFQRATKLSGTRFVVLKGLAARLERALINFMLDVHCDTNRYTEVATPYLVQKEMMVGTGQLPKFENEMFRLDSKDLFLIPTGEVSITNLYRDEILDGNTLPIKHVAMTPCFRREAGASGNASKGILRQHQFNKVELVNFVHPNASYEALEKLTLEAEDILKRLKLPYRVVRLCCEEVGFSAAMTYDIEVWMPSQNDYVEISSCSNFESFQARRANIRFRDKVSNKVQYVHTLNGSGLAVGRTLAAIMENYQTADGFFAIPEVLIPYMNGMTTFG